MFDSNKESYVAESVALDKILSSKRSNPYSKEKSIKLLREEHFNGSLANPLPKNTKWKKVDVGGVPAEWVYCSNISSDSVFLFIHGGGYYRGSAQASRSVVARISAAAGIRCLSIDYRLAPECPFPCAINDTYVSYDWLIRQGVSHKNIVVGGMSAGGGLSLALSLKLKHKRENQPCGLVAISPWTDMTQSGKTMKTNASKDPIISKSYLDRMAGLYLNGVQAKTPYASPLFGNLKGLPPTLIQVGSAETMLDDSLRMVNKAKKEHVEIEYECWQDMFHGWHGSAHILKEGDKAIKSIGKFCKRVLRLKK
jgi:monoterpene epsilon-lactone hydrolase